MKRTVLLSIVGFILFIGLMIGLSYAFGWIGVHQTKTIGKAQQNAKREVFEQTQSYVEGKRQAALKYYKEYQQADEDAKKGLKGIVSQDFANFDEDKYLTGELRNFIHNCKYNP
ncbi:hypothetical protein [Sunxiuqinia indica]|uniref:hypothetical protein n=1 Tax=Sunxiuqinia indica TaxID=2692584 RepID=UPI0013579FF7|nr:hypothetical protein [Sunxiuqinia indica]